MQESPNKEKIEEFDIIGENANSLKQKDELAQKLLEAEVTDKNQNIKLRKEYSDKVFILVCLYLVCVALLILFSKCIGISDNVLITILGTMTANILGLLYVVVKYLFNTK